MSWRDVLAQGGAAVREMSAENMAATRIMKGIGASVKDIGKLCSRFGIEYNEEESTFQRAVKILRETYDGMKMVHFVDVKTGKTNTSIYDDLLDDSRTGIVFYRIDGKPGMTAFIKGVALMYTALGRMVIKPGARYLANKDGVELWEQEPVRLIKSFSERQD